MKRDPRTTDIATETGFLNNLIDRPTLLGLTLNLRLCPSLDVI